VCKKIRNAPAFLQKEYIQRIVAALSKPGIGANGKSIPFLLEWLTRLHRQIGLNKYHST